MFSKLLVGFACFMLCSSLRVQGDEEPNYIVDFQSKAGLHIQFEQYKQVDSINADLLRVNREHIVNIIAYVKDTASKSLLGEKTGFWSTSGDLFNLYRARKKAAKGIDTKVGTNGQYNKDMRDMFQRMMKMGKAEEPNYKKGNQLELKVTIENLLDGLIEAIQVSPVANYFNFAKGKINGEDFEVYVSKLMAQLSKNGYGGLLGAVETLLSAIVKLSFFG